MERIITTYIYSSAFKLVCRVNLDNYASVLAGLEIGCFAKVVVWSGETIERFCFECEPYGLKSISCDEFDTRAIAHHA